MKSTDFVFLCNLWNENSWSLIKAISLQKQGLQEHLTEDVRYFGLTLSVHFFFFANYLIKLENFNISSFKSAEETVFQIRSLITLQAIRNNL